MKCPECGSAVKGKECSCGWGHADDTSKKTYRNPDGEGWFVEWVDQDDYGRRTKRRQFFANCKRCNILLPPFKLVGEYQSRGEPAGYSHKCGKSGDFYYLCSECRAGNVLPFAESRVA